MRVVCRDTGYHVYLLTLKSTHYPLMHVHGSITRPPQYSYPSSYAIQATDAAKTTLSPVRTVSKSMIATVVQSEAMSMM